MRDAVVEDFRRVPGLEVTTLDAVTEATEREAFELTAANCEWSLVIAPEFDHILSKRCRWVCEVGSGLLNPSISALELTSDKLALANHWRENGVPTPATTDRVPTACEAFPVVWKPRDGAGSTATFRLDSALDAARAKAQLAAENHMGTNDPPGVRFGPRRERRVPVRLRGERAACARVSVVERRWPIQVSGRRIADPARSRGARRLDRTASRELRAGIVRVRRRRSGARRCRGRFARLRHRDQPATDNFLRWAATTRGFQHRRRDAQRGPWRAD